MADQVTETDGAERPNPAKARTPAEFVDAMRRLKRWTGWGYRRLEKEAAAAGHVLPRSTLTTALARNTLPRADLVAAFAHACGCDEDQTAQWIAVRQRVAALDVPAGSEPGQTRPGTAVVLAGERPSVRRRSSWPVRAVAAVLTFAMAVAVVGYLLRQGSPSVPRPDQAAPARPDPSELQPPPNTPESTPVTTPPTDPATTASPIPLGPAAAVVTQTGPALPAEMPERPAPADPTGTVTSAPPPVPVESGRETIQAPGEPTLYCPTPYPDTPYGALGQCTQRSGDQARSGYYSPVTGQFGPHTDWMRVVDDKWYDALVLATDGVRAWARGYATVATRYGGGGVGHPVSRGGGPLGCDQSGQ